MYPFSLTVVLLLSDISLSHSILSMSFVERCFSNKTTTKRSKRSTTVILYLIHANDVSALFLLCVCVFLLFFFLFLLVLFSASNFPVLLCLCVALSNVCCCSLDQGASAIRVIVPCPIEVFSTCSCCVYMALCSIRCLWEPLAGWSLFFECF